MREVKLEKDISKLTADEYQNSVVSLLRETFPENQVKKEWDSIVYDNRRKNSHKTLYSPRIDVAVGPFNDYTDARNGNDETAVMKNSLLVRRLNERYDIQWNDLSKCFLAIEVIFSGSSKHVMGDFLNATSAGAIGIIVSRGKEHKKAMRIIKYLRSLEDSKRIEKRAMRNLMIFSDIEFLEFLEELNNPEKKVELKISDKYDIKFKDGYFSNNFILYSHVFWDGSRLNETVLKKIESYGFSPVKLIRNYSIVFSSTQFTYPCIAHFYEVILENDKHVIIFDIIDIAINSNYRNKGIGNKILNIFEEIAINNNCEYIFAELGDDYPETPLESQKRFFERNGFKMWHDKRGEFSGWICRKDLL